MNRRSLLTAFAALPAIPAAALVGKPAPTLFAARGSARDGVLIMDMIPGLHALMRDLASGIPVSSPAAPTCPASRTAASVLPVPPRFAGAFSSMSMPPMVARAFPPGVPTFSEAVGT